LQIERKSLSERAGCDYSLMAGSYFLAGVRISGAGVPAELAIFGAETGAEAGVSYG